MGINKNIHIFFFFHSSSNYNWLLNKKKIYHVCSFLFFFFFFLTMPYQKALPLYMISFLFFLAMFPVLVNIQFFHICCKVFWNWSKIWYVLKKKNPLFFRCKIALRFFHFLPSMIYLHDVIIIPITIYFFFFMSTTNPASLQLSLEFHMPTNILSW